MLKSDEFGKGIILVIEILRCEIYTFSIHSYNFSEHQSMAIRQAITDYKETFEKKMIILQKEITEHREPGTSAPQGEPGPPPSVLTPQSPCTTTRAVGVGTLYQDTIYAAAARTNVTPALLHRTGGVINPVGPEEHPCAGAPPPPPSHARAAILLQCQIKGNH